MNYENISVDTNLILDVFKDDLNYEVIYSYILKEKDLEDFIDYDFYEGSLNKRKVAYEMIKPIICTKTMRKIELQKISKQYLLTLIVIAKIFMDKKCLSFTWPLTKDFYFSWKKRRKAKRGLIELSVTMNEELHNLKVAYQKNERRKLRRKNMQTTLYKGRFASQNLEIVKSLLDIFMPLLSRKPLELRQREALIFSHCIFEELGFFDIDIDYKRTKGYPKIERLERIYETKRPYHVYVYHRLKTIWDTVC